MRAAIVGEPNPRAGSLHPRASLQQSKGPRLVQLQSLSWRISHEAYHFMSHTGDRDGFGIEVDLNLPSALRITRRSPVPDVGVMADSWVNR